MLFDNLFTLFKEMPFVGVLTIWVIFYIFQKLILDPINKKRDLKFEQIGLERRKIEAPIMLAEIEGKKAASEERKDKIAYNKVLAEIKNKELFLKEVNKNLIEDISKNAITELQHKKLWFANMLAEAESLEAKVVAYYLRTKKKPANKRASEYEGPFKDKMRELKKENALLKIENDIFAEYFPEYAELRDHILESEETLLEVSEEDDNIDMARKYLTPNEFNSLGVTERNQLALDKYKKRNHSNSEIGKLYERYLGYKYENKDWRVEFKGIIDGYSDLGRDLICRQGDKVLIVQAKNWSVNKTIHEKHIYQLFATKTHFCLEYNLSEEKKKNVEAIFETTTDLSPMAKKVAKYLNVKVLKTPLDKNYSMIKCNINPDKKSKIYHLPFDQQYDKIIIGDQKGEFYASTIKEAEKEGYRRAFRWKGTQEK